MPASPPAENKERQIRRPSHVLSLAEKLFGKVHSKECEPTRSASYLYDDDSDISLDRSELISLGAQSLALDDFRDEVGGVIEDDEEEMIEFKEGDSVPSASKPLCSVG